ncbi:MAG: hypothetical protein IKO72_03830 [Kiritimatiellae bacterium]|nr:hypothetical protein [Kiritimatiellia bacterium]
MKNGIRGKGCELHILSFLSLLSFSAFAAPVMPYGTYLVKGAFRGDYNTVLRDYGTATVRAQRADGTVIAESSVVSANEEGANFLLSIPVASAATTKSCKVGETLDCVLTTPQGTLDVPNSLTVDTPVRMGSVTFNCTEVKSYVNPKDGKAVKIPTAYVDEVQAWLDVERNGEAYDPWADYDNDGISNYGEFLAGTIPFDDSDYLRVKEFGMKDGKFALKFEHVGGHVYAVSSANTLAKPAWAQRRVRKNANGSELDQVLADGGEGAVGETEIFITPVGNATSEFFKLEAK